jgi:phage protein U
MSDTSVASGTFGTFGTIVFTVLGSPSNFQRSKKYYFAKIDVVEAPPVLQWVYDDLSEIKVDIELHYLWCNPENTINSITTLAQQHIPNALVIGPNNYGNFIISDVEHKDQWRSDNGLLLSSKLKITFTEWATALPDQPTTGALGTSDAPPGASVSYGPPPPDFSPPSFIPPGLNVFTAAMQSATDSLNFVLDQVVNGPIQAVLDNVLSIFPPASLVAGFVSTALFEFQSGLLVDSVNLALSQIPTSAEIANSLVFSLYSLNTSTVPAALANAMYALSIGGPICTPLNAAIGLLATGSDLANGLALCVDQLQNGSIPNAIESASEEVAGSIPPFLNVPLDDASRVPSSDTGSDFAGDGGGGGGDGGGG